MWSVRRGLSFQPSARRFSHINTRRYFTRKTEETQWKLSSLVASGPQCRAAAYAFEQSFPVRYVSVTAVARGESEQGDGRHSKLQCPRCNHPLSSATSVASM